MSMLRRLPANGGVNNVYLTSHGINAIAGGPANAGCRYTLYANGASNGLAVAGVTVQSDVNYPKEWFKLGSVNGAAYEVNATLLAGSITTGNATNTWLSLSGDKSWTITAPSVIGGSTRFADLNIQIRKTGTEKILANCIISMGAEATGPDV